MNSHVNPLFAGILAEHVATHTQHDHHESEAQK